MCRRAVKHNVFKSREPEKSMFDWILVIVLRSFSKHLQVSFVFSLVNPWNRCKAATDNALQRALPTMWLHMRLSLCALSGASFHPRLLGQPYKIRTSNRQAECAKLIDQLGYSQPAIFYMQLLQVVVLASRKKSLCSPSRDGFPTRRTQLFEGRDSPVNIVSQLMVAGKKFALSMASHSLPVLSVRQFFSSKIHLQQPFPGQQEIIGGKT